MGVFNLDHILGRPLSPADLGSIALCAYGQEGLALLDVKAKAIFVLDPGLKFPKRTELRFPNTRRKPEGIIGGLGHAKQTGPCATSDSEGNLYAYVPEDSHITVVGAQGSVLTRFRVDFPVECILVGSKKSDGLLVVGYRENFRFHKYSQSGKHLRSWMKEVPNSLLENGDPSPNPLLRTERGDYFFRVSEPLGVVDSLGPNFKLKKRLIRESSNYQRRVIVQSAVARPDVTAISLQHPGSQRRIHSLVPYGEGGCGLVVSGALDKERAIECYDQNLALVEVRSLPKSNGSIHSVVCSGPNNMFISTYAGELLKVRLSGLPSLDVAGYVDSLFGFPLTVRDEVNAPDGPRLLDSAISQIRRQWSLVTKGLTVVMSADLSKQGTLSAINGLRFLPWDKTPKAKAKSLESQMRRLVSSLKFGPPANSRIQFSSALTNRIEVLEKGVPRRSLAYLDQVRRSR